MTSNEGAVSTDGWVKDRPRMPGYGVPEGLDDTLDWSDVTERLTKARNFWVCTAATDGTPHAVPVWGAFLHGTLYFGVGPRSSRNLATNPRVSIHLESADKVVIVEGSVRTLHQPDPALAEALDDHFAAKYEWRPSGEGNDPVGEGWLTLVPERILGWTEFPKDATRWTQTERTD